MRASSQQVCSFEVNQVVTLDSVLQCVQSVPFSEEVRTATLDTMTRTFPLYAFFDIVQNSPDPIHFPMQVDLEAELSRIGQKSYSSDWDFQQDLGALFRSLNDGHTIYLLPSCYQSFSPFQPFILITVTDPATNQDVVKIAGAPSSLAAYEKLFNQDNLDAAIGGTVLEIDGEPAVDHLLRFANHSIGSSKDLNIRYNLANTRFLPNNNNGYYPGAFQQRSVMNPWPATQETVTYRVRLASGQETTYQLPWGAEVSHAYTGTNQFAQTCMANPAGALNAVVRDPTASAEVPQKILLPEMRTMSPGHSASSLVSQKLRDPAALHAVRASGADTSDITPLLVTPGISFYQLNSSVGVVVIPSFEPAGGMFQFSANLEKGFRLLKQKNLNHIILDLSHNGGGNLCLGYTVINFLFPDFTPLNGTYGNNDMIHSPLAATLVKDSVSRGVQGTYWSPSTWHSSATGQPFPDNTDWWFPGVTYTRGGIRNQYSEKFRDSCSFNFALAPSQGQFTPEKLLVLTDGWCGSTCAVTTSHLQEFDNVHTVAVGGLSGQAMQPFTTPGGQVTNVPTVLQMINSIGDSQLPISPPGFITSCYMGFTIREIYPFGSQLPNPLVPLEFYFVPATHRIQYTEASAMNPALVWDQAAEFFH
eukprot:CAMPEP_0177675720 /NCGR_PEP_ID=MMETSP0447-20121125/27361_1 /TAXON_ID=0 /ORGANISM="Stygamoeba regulata, Strain BSH-02190019" /LENGTH=644 /DNA_ID=CAMNT_0019184145 /DNA_START=163 /DNA_END=2097 /DNA_ORIENTATION=-